jgi:putative SOS response-associated peptidase YedK
MGGKAPVTNVRNTASAYWRPSIANKAQRCIVPATAFAEPHRNTSKPVVFRFRRTAGEPFFFAGI